MKSFKTSPRLRCGVLAMSCGLAFSSWAIAQDRAETCVFLLQESAAFASVARQALPLEAPVLGTDPGFLDEQESLLIERLFVEAAAVQPHQLPFLNQALTLMDEYETYLKVFEDEAKPEFLRELADKYFPVGAAAPVEPLDPKALELKMRKTISSEFAFQLLGLSKEFQGFVTLVLKKNEVDLSSRRDFNDFLIALTTDPGHRELFEELALMIETVEIRFKHSKSQGEEFPDEQLKRLFAKEFELMFEPPQLPPRK